MIIEKLIKSSIIAFFQVLLGLLCIKGVLYVVTVPPDIMLLLLVIPFMLAHLLVTEICDRLTL